MSLFITIIPRGTRGTLARAVALQRGKYASSSRFVVPGASSRQYRGFAVSRSHRDARNDKAEALKEDDPNSSISSETSGPSSSSSSPTPPSRPTRPPLRSPTDPLSASAYLAALEEREGGSAGTAVVDGQYESGMGKFTRANQYRLMPAKSR